MKRLLFETTIRDLFSLIKVGDKIKVVADKEYNLDVIKKEGNDTYLKLNDNVYLFKKNALQGDTLYYTKIINGQGGGKGKMEDVKSVTLIRGYDVIATVSTSQPEINKERMDFLKETHIDIKEELGKIKIDDRVIFETARLNKPTDEEDEDMIDESTITNITVDIIGVPREGFLKCKIISIKGNDTDKLSALVENELIFSKQGLSFSTETGSSLKLRDVITKHDFNLDNIVNIEIKEGQADKSVSKTKDKDKFKTKYYSDREIYDIVRNDPVMRQALVKRRGFFDFLLGHTHDKDKDHAISTLRDIKKDLNKDNYKKTRANKTYKTFTFIFESDTVDTDPNFNLVKGEKYTGKIIHKNYKGTRMAIYPFNNVSQKRILYTMDIPDELKKGLNSGKLYYGGKSEEKTRQFITNAEITIK